MRYVSDHLPSLGYSPKPIATRLGALSSFWTCMQQQLAVPLARNPWQGHRLSNNKRVTTPGPRSRKSPEVERAFTEGELVALPHGTERARGWDVYERVRDLLLLGLFTGGRLNELCSLLVKDVVITKQGRQTSALLSIREGNTDAAAKTMAVTHRAVLKMLQQQRGQEARRATVPRTSSWWS